MTRGLLSAGRAHRSPLGHGGQPQVLYSILASNPLRLVSRNGLTWLECTALARIPWLAHGFSTRLSPSSSRGHDQSGDFNLGLTPRSSPQTVERNRRRFAEAMGGFPAIASLKQVHSALIYRVGRQVARQDGPAGTPWSEGVEYCLQRSPSSDSHDTAKNIAVGDCESLAGDALLTSEPGVLLSVRTADCLPVLLVDRRLRVVAAVHAGWRGAFARIVEKTVGELRRVFNSRPRDLVAAVGPGIGRCCYEVGTEVVEAFAGQFAESDRFFYRPPKDIVPAQPDRYTVLFHTQAPPGHARPHSTTHLDLLEVVRIQLLAGGLRFSVIHGAGYCTACRGDLFFSHRREGARAGRMMAVIGRRE